MSRTPIPGAPRKKAGKKAIRQDAVLIDVLVQSPKWKAEPRAASIVRKAIRNAAIAASTPRAELAIVLTNDSAIHALNRDWRGQDKPTNVLSFPRGATARPEARTGGIRLATSSSLSKQPRVKPSQRASRSSITLRTLRYTAFSISPVTTTRTIAMPSGWNRWRSKSSTALACPTRMTHVPRGAEHHV